ncbi:transglycosylase SLT domain-containing protein, partial [Propionibacterium acidifaciens]|uniref:lytic transglycosylase domain-containing protein n=1 Tax=Propionibacterium acidifaciens TaxID=556499 RepID=UPI00361B2ABC
AAMDAVRGAAAKPINFVINTVYNDGIRRLVNAVVGVFGGDGLPEVTPITLARGAMMGDGRRPILWNEAGPEAYIPLDGSARSRSLWVQTGQALGALPMKDGGILDAAGDLVHLITDLPKTIGDLKDKLVEIGSTGWGRIIKGSITSLIDRAKTWVTDKLGSFGSSGGAGVDQWTSTAVAAMAAAGLPGTYLPLLMHRMQVESGGNPNAINLWDSNAQAGMPSQGLMQVIPPTFAAYAGPYAGLGITNPFANIYAAIKYSLARYGLQGIPAAWGGTGGYDTGGWLPPGATLAVNKTGKPEAVFTHEQLTEILDKLDALITAINLLIGRPLLDQQTLSRLLAGVAARRGEALV